MKLQDTTVLITGANRGIGAALVKAFQQAGVRKIYAAARNPASINIEGVTPIQLDVTNPEQVAAAAALAGDVTLVINNAGISSPTAGLLEAGALAAARAQFETNTLGVLSVSAAFAPVLKANGGGGLVNILSALSWVVVGGSGVYSASKAAAWAITNGLRNDLRVQGTKVLGVHFGYVDTDMTSGVDAPKADPKDIAAAILKAIENGDDELLADGTAQYVKSQLTAARPMYLGEPS
ncbi:SDR family oxidoreductase [Undibacterium sp.]|uniref:SDR family oxidoreductase n=1 Tax=Undibacterium sp. TaxID=1914977 RepID=UPI00374D8370